MNIIKSLLEIRPKGDSSSQLKQALSGAEAKRAEITELIASLQERRTGVLLDGEPADVEALEAQLAAARSEAERVSLIVAALPARIAAAEQREEGLRLDAVRGEADHLSAKAADLVHKIIKASVELAELVDQHDAAARRIMAANLVLKAGGRERVPLPTRRVWPNDQTGEVVAMLGAGLALPTPFGPRGPAAGSPSDMGLGEAVRFSMARAERTQMAAE